MSITQEFEATITALPKNDEKFNSEKIISLIDLTLLDKKATSTEITCLVDKAQAYSPAAICIYSEHYESLTLKNTNFKKATVVNFPTGNEDEKEVLHATEQIGNSAKIDEIDYVFPYQLFLDGNTKKALTHYKNFYYLAKELKLTVKVIIESGILPSLDSIYHLSNEILNIGCDFIKTSTGKTAIGATLPAAFAILKVIKKTQCGIKISGGIKSKAIALEYLKLAEFLLEKPLTKDLFRIGASQLLDDCLSFKNESLWTQSPTY